MPLHPHAYYYTALSFTILFCAAWTLTPYAAASISHEYDGMRRYDTNSSTIARLRARKQLQIQYSRHYNVAHQTLMVSDAELMGATHHFGRLKTHRIDAPTLWLLRLKRVLMVGV